MVIYVDVVPGEASKHTDYLAIHGFFPQSPFDTSVPHFLPVYACI
jgi:hypothetical protein